MQMQIDMTKYVALRDKDSIKLQKIGTKAVLFIRSFNPATGEEHDPQMGAINPKDLTDSKAALLAQVAGIDAMLADIEKLGVSTAQPE